MAEEQGRNRGEEFVALYNHLDAHLRQMLDTDRHIGFVKLAHLASRRDAAVRAYLGKIQAYAELRNAIVHDSDMQNGIIADPRPEALEGFRSLVEDITAPRTLLSISSREIVVHDPGEPLTRALSLMRYKGYAQVVVKTGREYGILSVEGVARWLQTQIDQDTVSVGGAKLGDAIEHEPPSTVEFLDRAATVYDAHEVFQAVGRHRNARLFALLITETGKRTETPIGIATPWDLFELAELGARPMP